MAKGVQEGDILCRLKKININKIYFEASKQYLEN